jgi:hypothetical protein
MGERRKINLSIEGVKVKNWLFLKYVRRRTNK